MYPERTMRRTETPGYSRGKQHFYAQIFGFRVVKLINPRDEENCIYVLKKVVPQKEGDFV